MSSFLQNVVNALQWGSFYALIALGYSMVYGVLMLFNFAHGDIFMVGAYIGFFIATGLISLSTMGIIVLPTWALLALTILLAMFLTSFVGMLVERIGYRPLRNAPRASAAITGLMIGIILETGNLAILGASRQRFPDIIQTTTFQIGEVSVTNTKILIVLISILLMLALHQFIQRTKWGMAMRAMSYDLW
jgi:branched-chain amino acid transport system permease protein